MIVAAAAGALTACGAKPEADVPSDVAITRGGRPPNAWAPIRPNNATPQIVAIWFSKPAYHWGEVALIRVVASTNVAAVEMRLASYGRPLHKVDYGQFHGIYHVPLLPPFVRPRYNAPFRFIARNSFGRSETVTAQVVIE